MKKSVVSFPERNLSARQLAGKKDRLMNPLSTVFGAPCTLCHLVDSGFVASAHADDISEPSTHHSFEVSASSPRLSAPLMKICYGVGRFPLSMDLGRDYDLYELVDLCCSFIDNGDELFLEFHPSLHLRLPTPHAVELACEMVTGYHNHLRSFECGRIWGAPDTSWVDSLCACQDLCHEACDDDECQRDFTMAFAVASQGAQRSRLQALDEMSVEFNVRKGSMSDKILDRLETSLSTEPMPSSSPPCA